MGKKKRLRVLGFFGFVYAVMALALVYFLFLNTGIVIDKKSLQEKNALELVVGNDSSHIIKDIKLSYVNDAGQKKSIGSVEILLPEETKSFEFAIPEDATGTINLVAEAPYHAVLREQIVFEVKQAFELSHTLTAADAVVLGNGFELALEICNNGSVAVSGVEVREEHSETFFAEESATVTIDLSAGECKQLNYTLNTIKAGSTEIKFTITADETRKELTKKVEIVG